MKIECALILLACGALSLGCRGLLGLDDEKFEGTGGSGGTPTDTGGSGGAVTAGGGGTGGGGQGGTGGATCPAQQKIDELDDDFDFPTCGSPDQALAERGWRFVVQEEAAEYAGLPEYPGVFVEDGKLLVAVPDTFYWSAGEQGFLMYKEVAGDFLVVARAKATLPMSGAAPADQQAGAGLLVRDRPDVAGDRWIAADRGFNTGNPNIHGTRSNAGGMSDSMPAATSVMDGAVAICRVGGVFSIWFDEQDAWVDMTNLLGATPLETLSTTVQVGLFAYDFNDPGMGDAVGVQGTFEYVRQHAPDGDCNPESHGEPHVPR